MHTHDSPWWSTHGPNLWHNHIPETPHPQGSDWHRPHFVLCPILHLSPFCLSILLNVQSAPESPSQGQVMYLNLGRGGADERARVILPYYSISQHYLWSSQWLGQVRPLIKTVGKYVKCLRKLSICQKGILEEEQGWLAGCLSFPCSEWALAFVRALHLLNNGMYLCEMNSTYAVFEENRWLSFIAKQILTLGWTLLFQLLWHLLSHLVSDCNFRRIWICRIHNGNSVPKEASIIIPS